MSAAEVFFLALGLCLGIAVGAALLDIIRAKPPHREVRLTITHNAIPARAAVTAEPAFGPAAADFAPAADPGRASPLAKAQPAERVAIAVAGGVDPAYAAIDRVSGPVAVGAAAGGVGMAMASADPSGHEDRIMDASDPSPSGGSSTERTGVSISDVAPDADPCGPPRRLAAERCAVAEHAREQFTAVSATLQTSRREYDAAALRIDQATAAIDPRAIANAKDGARDAFRAGRRAATSRLDLERAATAWLTEINRINMATRDAGLLLARERDGTTALLASIERQSLAVDAARITADAAGAACDEARRALAACEGGGPAVATAVAGTATGEPAASPADWDREGGRQPVIVRLLQGDTAAMNRLVAGLGGDDPNETSRYQLWISELVDGIFAGAIDDAILDFPLEHPFWGSFERSQCREIVIALASLGFRYDGIGSFAADRVPGQRELSMAVGYAGLDPMRMRRWPTASEMPELFKEVTVAADEFLGLRAPDLALGDMVALLGRRSEGLAELWNRWDRIRPVLLAAPD